MKTKWYGGWPTYTKEELARRERKRQLRLARQANALVILAAMKRADAIVVIAGMKNWSQQQARKWLKEMLENEV